MIRQNSRFVNWHGATFQAKRLPPNSLPNHVTIYNASSIGIGLPTNCSRFERAGKFIAGNNDAGFRSL